MKPQYPNWICTSPEPQPESRRLSGYPMEGWLADVEVSSIEYWADNRRTDVQVRRLKSAISRTPTDDELFRQLVDDPDLHVERLAKNILLNGLREPLIISHDKVLLDGNRRYLAHRWIMQNGQPYERDRFSKVRAWVLKEEFSGQREKLRVITEYNFLNNLHKEWNDYVKAKLLYDEYNSKADYTYDDLEKLYGGPGFRRSKIIEFIKTYEIIQDFINQSPDPDDAETRAAANFIWFQQVQRSYRDAIRNDDDFQQAVFANIAGGYIKTTDQLKSLNDVQKIPDAWVLFKKGEVAEAHRLTMNIAAERAKTPDAGFLFASINAYLEQMLATEGLAESAPADTVARFHELAQQVPGQITDVNARVDYFARQLQAMTSEELTTLTRESIEKLEGSLRQVIKQARATKND